jgi:putative transcriptional regulator
MIVYRIDVLEKLKSSGYSTYKLRKDKIMGEATIQQLRNNLLASWATIDTICRLLNCQPGDILEYKEEG